MTFLSFRGGIPDPLPRPEAKGSCVSGCPSRVGVDVLSSPRIGLVAKEYKYRRVLQRELFAAAPVTHAALARARVLRLQLRCCLSWEIQAGSTRGQSPELYLFVLLLALCLGCAGNPRAPSQPAPLLKRTRPLVEWKLPPIQYAALEGQPCAW